MDIKLWIRRHTPMKEWAKFQIADWLNNRYKEACWANLVMWALGYKSWKEMFWWDYWKSQSCREEDGAYCGKCKAVGRLSW